MASSRTHLVPSCSCSLTDTFFPHVHKHAIVKLNMQDLNLMEVYEMHGRWNASQLRSLFSLYDPTLSSLAHVLYDHVHPSRCRQIIGGQVFTLW